MNGIIVIAKNNIDDICIINHGYYSNSDNNNTEIIVLSMIIAMMKIMKIILYQAFRRWHDYQERFLQNSLSTQGPDREGGGAARRVLFLSL